MKGEHSLIKQRIDGFKPFGIWISHAPTPYFDEWHKNGTTFLYPEIQILQYENPAALFMYLDAMITVNQGDYMMLWLELRLLELLRYAVEY
jgi:hypothetical protein